MLGKLRSLNTKLWFLVHNSIRNCGLQEDHYSGRVIS